MAKAKNEAVSAKQTRRSAASRGIGETEAMPEAGSAQPAPGAPIVHNVVLGGYASGQPVNLLELLMEEQPAAGNRTDRTTLVEAPGRSSAPARARADLTAPMEVADQLRRPGPSDFTAVLQAFQPASGQPVRVPTETDRPRVDVAGTNRVDTPPAEADGSGHTQVMNLSAASGTQVVGAVRRPDPVDRPAAEDAEPVLAGALRRHAPEAASAASPGGMAALIPWLLLAIAVELLAILAVLLIGLRR